MPVEINQTSPSLFNLKIKLAFFDIDGTLIGSDNLVSPAVQKALINLSNSGCQLALASGRPYFAAKDLIAKLNISAPCLFYSGSLIIEPQSAKIMRSIKLEQDLINLCINFAKTNDIYYELYTVDNLYIQNQHKLAEIHSRYLQRMPTITNFSELIKNQPILKIVLACEDPKKTQLTRNFAAQKTQFSCGIGYGAADPDITFFNFTSPEAAREKAFYFILESLGVNSCEVAAFGDGEADLPFIKLAGFGVAMGNAPAAVRASAPFVTETVDNDGVALAISKLLA